MASNQLKTYAKLCTEFYDLEHHVNGTAALAFYMHHARQAHGPILEPMCGSGRFLLPMLQEGLDVQGFDASTSMLEALRKKYAQISNQEAPVRLQFVQDFTSNQLYQLIFIPYGSWGLITDLEESKKALNVLYRHLGPGGKLIIEIETVSSVPEPCGVLRRGVHTRADGSKIALSFIVSYDKQTQMFRSHSRYESIVNNGVQETEEELFEQHLYKVDEFDQLLHAIGCANFIKYPAFDPTLLVNDDTPVIIYKCTKE